MAGNGQSIAVPGRVKTVSRCVESGNPGQGLPGDGCGVGHAQLVELAPDVRPAAGLLDALSIQELEPGKAIIAARSAPAGCARPGARTCRAAWSRSWSLAWVAPLANAPALRSRNQPNTKLAFTPCLRATTATDAAGAIASTPLEWTFPSGLQADTYTVAAQGV